MRRPIWTIFSFIVALITVIVILRFFGLTVKDLTDSLSEGLKYVGEMLDTLRNATS